MKKIISILVAVTMIVGMFVLTASAAPVPAEVGRISEGRILPEFVGKEQALTNAFKAAYAEAIKLKAYDLNANFNPGESTEEYVHDWVGDTYKTMAQDFTGGNSNCFEAFGQKEGWNVFLCYDPNTLKVYHVRDGIAQAWASNGGTNSNWGLPTSNQFWGTLDGELVVIQEFMNGYAYGPDNNVFDITFVPFEEDPDYSKPADATAEHPNVGGGNGGDVDDTPSNTDPGPQTSEPVDSSDTGTEPSNGEDTSGDNGASQDTTDNSEEDTSQTTGTSSKSSNTSSTTSGQATGGTSDGKELNLPATIGLIAGIVVVLGGGGFALYWFVLRKKPAVAEGDASVVEEESEEDSDEE